MPNHDTWLLTPDGLKSPDQLVWGNVQCIKCGRLGVRAPDHWVCSHPECKSSYSTAVWACEPCCYGLCQTHFDIRSKGH